MSGRLRGKFRLVSRGSGVQGMEQWTASPVDLLEEQDVRLGLMDLVVFPPQALCVRRALAKSAFQKTRTIRMTYLSNTDGAPFVLPQQLQCSVGRIVVILRNGLQHGLGELDVSVLVLAVRVAGKALLVTDGIVLFVKALPGRVMDRVDEFLKSRSLIVAERPRDLVAAARVDIHWHLDPLVTVARELDVG